MQDSRIKKLARILVNYSIKVKKEEKVLIECTDPLGLPLASQVYKEILTLGAYPHLSLGTEDLIPFYFKKASDRQLTRKPEILDYICSWLDKSIRIKASLNDLALANISPQKTLIREQTLRPINDKIIKKPWVLTYFPTESMAQSASLSLEEMENFYFQACLQDWPKIGRKLQKIKKVLDNAKLVQVIGKKTNLKFSLASRLSAVCDGQYNMPDGEVFGAPLDGTMNGEIYFEFPSLRQGKEVKDIYLKFKNGKVVYTCASKNLDYLKKALTIDPGASRPGEFAIGGNYGIKRFFNNTLFDEKIGGTIHLALGKAYEDKLGGGENKSAIHWDLVKDTRIKGSKVIVDGKTILKDGKLVLKSQSQ